MTVIINRFPPVADFMLLGKCNLCCTFCFGPRHHIPPIKTVYAKKIIMKLAKNGVKKIVFTGGEPTLIKDLPDILKTAKKYKLTTVLSTNGIILASDKKLLDKIAPHLDWISLPLEGNTEEINAKMRMGKQPNIGRLHFKIVLKLIPEIRQKYPKLKIKLGTVVAKPNLNHIIGIPYTLNSHKAFPDTWKLYQVSPSEYAKINYSALKVNNKEFGKLYKRVLKAAKQFSFTNIVTYTNNKRLGQYFFVNPLGDVLIIHPKTNDYYKIGNLISNFDKVIKDWEYYVNEHSLVKNFESTYPLD